MKIYLAGPDVFRPDAAVFAANARRLMEERGHIALLPLDNEETTAEGIFRANLGLVSECDALIANLNPFRGDEPDSGTSFEVGCAIALGKRVVGYVADARPMAVKLCEKYGIALPDDESRPLDPHGNVIENFGLPLNLMLAVPCRIVQGGLEDAVAALCEAS